jgi:hypothetical protein
MFHIYWDLSSNEIVKKFFISLLILPIAVVLHEEILVISFIEHRKICRWFVYLSTF